MNILSKFFGGTRDTQSKLLDIDHQKLELLYKLLDSPPQEREASNQWTYETGKLIDELLLQRISNADLSRILAGFLSYRANGITSEAAQHALISGFCCTSGLLQDILHKIVFSSSKNKLEISDDSLFFGRFDSRERSAALKSLCETGYAVLPKRLSVETLAELNSAAEKMHFDLRANEQRLRRIHTIDPKNPPDCNTADADNEEVLANKTFNALYNDPQIISILESFIGAPIIPITPGLRYSFPSQIASSDCAQLFHYDLDTLRWLKVFYYLNDVGSENGPHIYIEGSHAPGSKPAHLLARGYDRIMDDEIADAFPNLERSIQGPAGTVVIGDTRAYHKGLNVLSGYRLLFFPLYAPSKFGFDHGSKEA